MCHSWPAAVQILPNKSNETPGFADSLMIAHCNERVKCTGQPDMIVGVF